MTYDESRHIWLGYLLGNYSGGTIDPDLLLLVFIFGLELASNIDMLEADRWLGSRSKPLSRRPCGLLVGGIKSCNESE